MIRTAYRIASWTLVVGVTAIAGCSSDDDDSNNNDATGGASGTGGSGAGGECTTPPVTDHGKCEEIASEKSGDAGFTISSPDFAFCGEMPAGMTCDGNDFGTGDSPTFEWSGVPAGTKSLAAVFKDISILSDNNPATEKFGYHWVMWDIPPTATGLPGKMTGGFKSAEVDGASQWSSLGSYGFFTPCPNPFPKDAPMFQCALTRDSYSLTLYALSEEKLTELPAPDMDPATGMPVPGSNWVVNMAHYIEGLTAIAVTEYRGTSKAWAKAFVPPNAAEFPCSAEQLDAGMTDGCLH